MICDSMAATHFPKRHLPLLNSTALRCSSESTCFFKVFYSCTRNSQSTRQRSTKHFSKWNCGQFLIRQPTAVCILQKCGNHQVCGRLGRAPLVLLNIGLHRRRQRKIEFLYCSFALNSPRTDRINHFRYL
jgi:hypothetical protein